ncbi:MULTISPECIES: hypothetical protein [unclassified Actinomyces]|uniref:hypothetical protein n=1 Tax=unclassified Actinomyces TaxID=2609248 RepID=UPI002017CAD3|nr:MULTISPECIES: hypothetical protein [unclassified Actinomyces]MCL3778582.1 DUF4439 domain-containing protein [Actinomyces sp. AC-20-1]MCL3789607.1 DUF4439 domain-containing protein [Actinomyces sp. 187325]MCL3792232.1 DUF4439 domain-containing protein [Actinomyces sp. 186855]MCL3794538.1 DUF4439 domain-containing protein [Actinomyces sp. 217892]
MTRIPAGPAGRPTTLRRAAALLTVCALAAGATGCGLRIGEAVPRSLPSASEQESVRDALARRTVLVSSTASSLLAASPEDPAAGTASALVEDTAVQLEALGGVWQPYATPVPTTYPTASPVATAATGASRDALVQVLQEGAAQARQAALDATGAEDASLYGAVAVSWSVALAALEPGSVSAVGRDVLLTEPLPGDLLQAYDAARYALEEVAARSDEEPRARAQDQAAAADDLVNASLALGGEDTRLPAYAAPAAEDGASAEVTWARQVWLRLADAEVVAVGATTGQARAEALDAAVDAALTAVAWGAGVSALPGY